MYCCLLKTLSKALKIYMKKKNFKINQLLDYFLLTIGVLTLLTYKTEYGIFLIASFGSSMVLLYGYPESPFAQPKNIFFGHFNIFSWSVFFYTFSHFLLPY